MSLCSWGSEEFFDKIHHEEKSYEHDYIILKWKALVQQKTQF